MAKKCCPILATGETFFSNLASSCEVCSIGREVFYIDKWRNTRSFIFFVNDAVNVEMFVRDSWFLTIEGTVLLVAVQLTKAYTGDTMKHHGRNRNRLLARSQCLAPFLGMARPQNHEREV